MTTLTTDLTPRQVLQEMRLLIQAGWCQYRLSLDLAGVTVPWQDATAARFCPLGAACRVTGSYLASTITALSLFKTANGIFSISHWNDQPGRTQQDVLQALDRAIEAAQ